MTAASMTNLNDTSDLSDKGARRGDAGMSPKSRLELIHRTMRGRYPYAIALTIVGVIVGAIVGYQVPTPTYRSTGAVRITSVLPTVMFEDDQSLAARFEEFIKDQMDLIVHQDLIEKAMATTEWKTNGWGSDQMAYIRFKNSLKVENERKSEQIKIHFRDKKPEVAKAAVEALTTTYMKVAEDQQAEAEAKRLRILEDERRQVAGQLDGVRRQILANTNQLGADALSQLYNSKLNRLQRLEEQLDQVKTSLRSMRDVVQQSDLGISTQLVAAYDDQMRTFLRQRFLIEQEIARMKATYGIEHRMVRERQMMLDNVNETINLHLREVQASGLPGMEGMEIARLEAQQENLGVIIEDVTLEANEIGRRTVQVASLQEQEKVYAENLEAVNKRIREREVESAYGGRFTLVSTGDLPAEPWSDKRAQASVALAVLGGTFGFALVLMVGFLDPRIRSFDDVRASMDSTPVLGVLPQLPENLSDAESVAMAAHCVHNVRTLMQIGSTRDDRHVFAITSPGPQSGKTSLSLALGMSFAGTGSKTLLIDCDLVAGGLSRRVEAIVPGKKQHPLVREGVITQWQFDQAQGNAEAANRDLIEVLVELGYLQYADVERAKGMLHQEERGLIDVVGGESLESCIMETEVPNLYVLTVGKADERDVSRLSPKVVRWLLDDARQQFETVVVDTGPTPASLEASLVSAAADGVVLVVARGEDRLQAESSIQHLRSCDANVIGMVFNRAEASDMESSGAASASRRSIRTAPLSPITREEGDLPSQFGPLGRSVAWSNKQNEAQGGGTSARDDES